MAEVVTLSWSSGVAVAAAEVPSRPVAALDRLPADWEVTESVVVDDIRIDHAVVGPNGVFTVTVDQDPEPALPQPDGLYRHGIRVTTPVKEALGAAHRLRRRLDLPALAYPILVSHLAGPGDHLDRLGVVPGDRIAEHIWSHPGFPLRRSQRHEILWALRRLR